MTAPRHNGPSLAGAFASEQAAVDALISNGFQVRGQFYGKRSMTGGSLAEAPRPCLALCKVRHNPVHPRHREPDYYTIDFH